jgi:hypothetical protein
MDLFTPAVERTAMLSGCGKYRYRLGRRWGAGAPLLFVMLNPSTADAAQDDPTIRRCIGFAHTNGFTAMEVVNLFAFRATDPGRLLSCGAPVGPGNDVHIAEAARETGAVCLAYGAHPAADARAQVVLPLLRELGVQLQCLRVTRSGYPAHPLYLPAACRLMPFTDEAIEAAMTGAV